MVTYSGIFPWIYFTCVHILWKCLYSDLHQVRITWNGRRGYIHTWIILVMPEFFMYRLSWLLGIPRSEVSLVILCVWECHLYTSWWYTNISGKFLKPTMLMIIYSVTKSLVFPLWVYFIWPKKLQWFGIKINIILWIHPHVFLSLFLPISVWRRLLICVIPFDTLVYPFDRKSTCLKF